MKKLFLTLVAVIVAATMTYAQDVYVATLNHEGTITEYYGSSSLGVALNNAVDGDIITLSEGVFTSSEWSSNGTIKDLVIDKAVTIRGAGMTSGTLDGISLTTVSTFTRFHGSGMTIEGIEFPKVTLESGVSNATFVKCKLRRYSGIGNFTAMNSSFYDCICMNFRFSSTSENNRFYNSHVTIDYQFYNAALFNCLIYYNDQYNNTDSKMYNCNFSNCVIATKGRYLSATNKVANCIGIDTNATIDIFSNMPERIDSNILTTDVFKSWDDASSTTNLTVESYELTDEGKTYLGVDGTQIGILGGNYPYNPTVSIPRITKCEVANKATADGKLSVNIEVTAPATE